MVSDDTYQKFKRIDPLVGVSLEGRYTVESAIARGGMGVVYRGFDIELQRPVAIKVLIKNLNKVDDSVVRFLREARAMSGLDHPNIVPVYATGTWRDRHYFVMKLLEGKTLSARLKKVRLRLEDPISEGLARRWLIQLCDGLGYAHGKGLIHRDVKPSNIMTADDGHLTVMDFGIVKENTEETLTQTGIIFGTPDYMSPEYAQGLQATEASDQYALGVVTYEILSGRPPFMAPTAFEVVIAHIKEMAPPISTYRASIDPRLEQIVSRMIQKAPADRFESLAEIKRAVEEIERNPLTEIIEKPTVKYAIDPAGETLQSLFDEGRPTQAQSVLEAPNTSGETGQLLIPSEEKKNRAANSGTSKQAPQSPPRPKVHRGERPDLNSDRNVHGEVPSASEHELSSIVISEGAGIYRRAMPSPPVEDQVPENHSMNQILIVALATALVMVAGAAVWWFAFGVN